MFRSSTALLGLFCFLSLATFEGAHAEPAPIPKAPEVSARAYILTDYQSGRILGEEHADDREEPASLTKLMTAYVVFTALKEQRLKLTDMVTISEHAWRAEGSRILHRRPQRRGRRSERSRAGEPQERPSVHGGDGTGGARRRLFRAVTAW